MRVIDLITKTRDGKRLSAGEIEYLIQGYVHGKIPDYQMAAWTMAVYLKGLSEEETIALTKTMLHSGDTMDLTRIQGVKLDKHSTGGVGDTTTLILGPIVAACGIPVTKMSGRGLGHTGGTIDKLESIPGFNVELTKEEFIEQVNRIKIAVAGQTGNLVPADKKLYALRDVTATVESIPLIASSVMSKKLASGADRILLDVKVGSGAFLKDLDQAKYLAQLMVAIGNSFNKKTIAVISNMDQPLGEAVGNSLEVLEAIEVLKGKGPEDLKELCLVLAGYMFVLGEKVQTFQEGQILAEEIISSGKGLAKFKELVEAQGGDVAVIDNYDLLPKGSENLQVCSPEAGYIAKINAELIGKASMILGAGREKKEDKINLGVGVRVLRKIGDKVAKNEVLAEIIHDNPQKAEEARRLILDSYQFSPIPVTKPKLILDVIL